MILKIKETLYGNRDKIQYILEELNCYNIQLSGDKFRFGLDEEGQGNGNSLDINTLGFYSFSENKKGDVLTLTSLIIGGKLNDAIIWLANKLNLSYDDIKKVDVKLPFGGFFKNYSKVKEVDESPPKTYDINRLDEFNNGVSLLFIKDGISAKTQEEFNIGFDTLTNRITLPWFNPEGELIGIMGRLNKQELTDKDSKYLPIIPFRKSKALYGFDINYKGILEKNYIIICESEKSVQKARQYGFNNVVALGGNEIHSIPQKLIKSMYCDVIIALDEGIKLEHNIEQAKKVQIRNPFFSNEVYILDMTDLPSKSCIFDLDYKTIENAFKERLIYID